MVELGFEPEHVAVVSVTMITTFSLSPVRWSWDGSGVKGLCGRFWDSGVPEDDGGLFADPLGREGLQIPAEPCLIWPLLLALILCILSTCHVTI